MTTTAPATPAAPAQPAQDRPSSPPGGQGPRPGGPGGYQQRGPRPQGGPRPGGRPRGRYAPRRRVCAFCVEHVKLIDYKDYERLRRYVSDRGKIEPRRKSGVCAKHQRALSNAIKRARHLALLPYVPMQTMRSGIRR